MAEYNITLNEEELEYVLFGLSLAFDRCCFEHEERPIIELIEKLKKQRGDCNG